MCRPSSLCRTLVACLLLLFPLQSDVFADIVVVSNRDDETIQIFDASTKETIATYNVGVGAHEFAVSPNGRFVVGSCYGSGPGHRIPDNRLLIVDLQSPEKPRLIDLGDNPRPNDLRFVDGNTIVGVTSEQQNGILFVDIESGEIAREVHHGVTAGHMVAFSPDRMRAFVPSVRTGELAIVDVADDADPILVKSIMVGAGAEGVDISPDGKHVWTTCHQAGRIAIVDTARLEIEQTIEANGFPFRVRITPNGKTAIVSCPGANVIRLYDTATFELKGEIETPGGVPTSIAVSNDSNSAYIICGQIMKIAVVTLGSEPKVTHWLETGNTPDAIAYSSFNPVVETVKKEADQSSVETQPF